VSDDQPSDALRALLDAKLDTLEKLEIVLALRDAPDRSSSVEALAHHLQVGPSVLRQVVDEVARANVVTVRGDIVELVLDGSNTALLDEASALHHGHRHELIRVFSMIAMARIRQMAARTFADAFQIRKKKKDGDHG
jgi:hypothetical protein